MKKGLFTLLSLILCFSLVLSGCTLFYVSPADKNNQIALETNDIIITREEFLKGYNSYYETFYNNNSNDSEKALEDLIEYLVSKKLYIKEAENLIERGEIYLTRTEENYIWYGVYTALVNNIETFEEEVKKELKIEEDEDDELEKEENFIYTPYDKIARVVLNEETGKYEVQIIKTTLLEKINNGEISYKYVPIEEAEDPIQIFNKEYIKNLINSEKLYEGKSGLTEEELLNKDISKESIRRYIKTLKENEEGKNLSTDDESVYNREIDRIYKIVYENLLINKLYTYKVSSIDISEEDVLNRYLENVKASYERYSLNLDTFSKELTSAVGSTKYYSAYSSSESNCIEDVFYVPVSDDEEAEEYFYITHIMISLSEEKVQLINELKQKSETEGWTEEQYQTAFDAIVDKESIKLDERDENGYVVVKSTDENAISVQDMIDNLTADLQEIDNEYDPLDGTEDGVVNLSPLSSFNHYYSYIHARAEVFRTYIYKYSDDSGSVQIQKTIVSGKTNENWYTYALGTDETDASFVEKFVDTARDLYEEGIITDTAETFMESWKTSNNVDTLQTGSTGWSVLMYCGQVKNLFESFDEQDFSLEGLPADALLKMDYQRLGLTMNKTLFDLIFEQCYDEAYDRITKVYEDEILKNVQIIKHSNVYRDIIG